MSFCASCRSPVQSGWHACPACGTRIVAAPVVVPSCSKCHAALQNGWKCCPFCTTPIQLSCSGCKAAIQPGWKACPACDFAVGSVNAENAHTTTTTTHNTTSVQGGGAFQPGYVGYPGAAFVSPMIVNPPVVMNHTTSTTTHHHADTRPRCYRHREIVGENVCFGCGAHACGDCLISTMPGRFICPRCAPQAIAECRRYGNNPRVQAMVGALEAHARK